MLVDLDQVLDGGHGSLIAVRSHTRVAREGAGSVDPDRRGVPVGSADSQVRATEDAGDDQTVDLTADEIIDQPCFRVRGATRRGHHQSPVVAERLGPDRLGELDEERVARVGEDQTDHVGRAPAQRLGMDVRAIVEQVDGLAHPGRGVEPRPDGDLR